MKNTILELDSYEGIQNVMDQFKSLSLEDKVDYVITVLLDMKISVDTNKDQVNSLCDVKEDVGSLKVELQEARGKITRLETKMKKMERK